jgi:hypothetical protein
LVKLALLISPSARSAHTLKHTQTAWRHKELERHSITEDPIPFPDYTDKLDAELELAAHGRLTPVQPPASGPILWKADLTAGGAEQGMGKQPTFCRSASCRWDCIEPGLSLELRVLTRVQALHF